MHRFATVTLAAGLIAGLAPAQEQRSPQSLIPANAVLVAWIDGPGALQAAFENTRLARMLAGPELSAMIAPALGALRAAAMSSEIAEAIDLEQVEADLAGYSGRVMFALGLDVETLMAEMDGPNPPSPAAVDLWMMVIATGDGETDLEAATARLREIAEQEAPPGLREVSVGDRDLLVGGDEEMHLALPFMLDDNAVFAITGAEIEPFLDRVVLGMDDSFEDVRLPDAAMGVWGTVRQFIRAVTAAGEARGGLAAGTLTDIFASIGLDALDVATMTAAPAGEHVIVEFGLQCAPEATGFLGAVMDIEPGPPNLLDYVPMQRTDWSVNKINVPAVIEALRDLGDVMAPVTGMTVQQLEGMFAERFKVRLVEDLLAQLNGELLAVGIAAADEEDNPTQSPIAGACWVLDLKDGETFGKSLETAVRSQGLHAARKTETYRDVEVYRIPFGGVLEIYYTVTDRLLGVALGGGGYRELRAVLDERAARREGVARAELPDAVQERLDRARPDWQNIGRSDMATFAQTVITGLQQFSREIGQELPVDACEMLRNIPMLTRRYGLETIVTVGRSSKKAMRAQMIW